MPKDKQFQLRTRYIATRDVAEYRDTIGVWVHKDDVVLEVGCEWGTTTRLIAPNCKEIIATDVSPECIARARETVPGVRFEVLDGFDVRGAIALDRPFTKIYIDISGLSGYHSLLDGISLLTMYATVFRPEAIVIKCASIKHFITHCFPWRGTGSSPIGLVDAKDDL